MPPLFGHNRGGWAVSSVVEHFVHTEGVTGSSPVPPTMLVRRIVRRAVDATLRDVQRVYSGREASARLLP